ncbi:DnaT-like ssDNA-binding domain-containing protein [Marinomonas sp. IMCC 4694]|uniref:DnaT-like ssDNA-binding domain-containing protein n=1 Tax=Marinomonas sp. IMCC 4694 TaxID=2605432 RepID=UPI0021CD10AE|nr:DnaT-like ssDNA-binding domain-containing protein [Marinomonas sp. IMCC 4694]
MAKAFDKLLRSLYEVGFMLDNDYSLPISFSTAAQIGLEETVLLTFLKQQAYLVNSTVLRVEMHRLSAQLPFWTVPMLMKLLGNLQLSQLLSFQRQEEVLEIHLVSPQKTAQAVKPTVERSSSDESLMNKMDRLHKASRDKNDEFTPQSKSYPTKPPVRQYGAPPSPPVANDRRGVTDFDLYLEQKERARQPDQWQPEEATLEQIVQSGIAREFALTLQTEFLLRIKEQRKNVRTWNSEFFKYVKRQWQYKQSDRSSYEGTSGSSKFTKTSREQVSDALNNIHDTDW